MSVLWAHGERIGPHVMQRAADLWLDERYKGGYTLLVDRVVCTIGNRRFEWPLQ